MSDHRDERGFYVGRRESDYLADRAEAREARMHDQAQDEADLLYLMALKRKAAQA